MERQSDYFEAFLREELTHLVNRVAEQVVEQVVERLTERFTRHMERLERPKRPERSRPAPSLQAPSPPTIAPPSKAEVVTRMRTLREAGPSLQQIADLFNAEALPTLSGREHWQKGTISNLLAQAQPNSTFP
jgi:Recombinase